VCVERAGGLVQDQHPWVRQDRPGDGQQLHLPLGEVDHLLVEHGGVAAGQGADEVIDVRRPGGLDDLGVGCLGPPVADGLQHRAVEQPGVLQHHAEQAAQVRAGEVPQVVTINADGTARDVVEAHYQLDHYCLAGPGRVHDGNLLAGRDLRREVVDHQPLGLVAVVHAVELDPAIDPLQANGLGWVGGFGEDAATEGR